MLIKIFTALTAQGACDLANKFIETLKPGQVGNIQVTPLVLGNVENETVEKGIKTNKRVKMSAISYSFNAVVHYARDEEMISAETTESKRQAYQS